MKSSLIDWIISSTEKQFRILMSFFILNWSSTQCDEKSCFIIKHNLFITYNFDKIKVSSFIVYNTRCRSAKMEEIFQVISTNVHVREQSCDLVLKLRHRLLIDSPQNTNDLNLLLQSSFELISTYLHYFGSSLCFWNSVILGNSLILGFLWEWPQSPRGISIILESLILVKSYISVNIEWISSYRGIPFTSISARNHKKRAVKVIFRWRFHILCNELLLFLLNHFKFVLHKMESENIIWWWSSPLSTSAFIHAKLGLDVCPRVNNQPLVTLNKSGPVTTR